MSMQDIQPHALLELTKPVKADLCSAMPVPASWSRPAVLPAGLRIRVAWDFMPGDGTMYATPEDDRDRKMLEAAMQGKDGIGNEVYGIRIDPVVLEGNLTAIENRVWTPQDMDLAKAGHMRLIARHLGLDNAWLDILPPSIRAGIEQALEHLRRGSITHNEFINEVLGILDAPRNTAR